MSQFLGFLLLFNVSACGGCEPYAYSSMAGISMRINPTLLLGTQENIEVTLQLDDLESYALVGDFKLKVDILEQKTFTGTTTGSQISYKDARGAQQAFSDPFEKALTEFTSFIELKSGLTEFKVSFSLLPASQETVKIRLNFGLIDRDGKNIQNIEVKWIRSKIIVTPPTEIKGKEGTFTLQNLGEDIEDLSKIVLAIQGFPEGASFSFGETGKSELTLAELLPGVRALAKDQETVPIKVILDDIDDDGEAVFTILVVDRDAIAGSEPLAQEKGKKPKLTVDAEDAKVEEYVEELEEEHEKEKLEAPKLSVDAEDAKVEEYVEELEGEHEKEKLEEQELKRLTEEKEELSKEVKREKKTLRQKLISDLKELKKKRNEELKGKDQKEKGIIKKKYKKRKREILAAAGAKMLRARIDYGLGFGNAIGNSLFGIPLRKPKNSSHYNGQQYGHKAGVAVGGLEGALGAALLGVGVFAVVGGSAPSLGTTVALGVPTLVVGGGLVAHGVFVVTRAQGNLGKDNDKTFSEEAEKGTQESKNSSKEASAK